MRGAIGDAMASSAARAGAAALALVDGPRLSILIFHRVLPHADPLFPGEVDSARFERLMGVVARSFHVVRLDDAASMLANGTLPRRALAITFDDGYADNEVLALPVLQRHGLSATFFVSTGFLDGGRMWNDSVIEIVRATSREWLKLDFLGQGRMRIVAAAERRGVIDRILSQVKYMGLREREDTIGRLYSAAGSPPLPADLMMERRQVRALHAAGMEIGAHTVHHPILATLADIDAEREILAGREQLESLVDASVVSLAYPNGRPGRDYDRRHVDMAVRLGFRVAVSTAPGAAGTGADLHQLPRFTPWDATVPRWLARLVAMRRPQRFLVA